MLHNKRFNKEYIAKIPETDPRKMAGAIKKAEKEVVKMKLDRLSYGLMNLLQEK